MFKFLLCDMLFLSRRPERAMGLLSGTLTMRQLGRSPRSDRVPPRCLNSSPASDRPALRSLPDDLSQSPRRPRPFEHRACEQNKRLVPGREEESPPVEPATWICGVCKTSCLVNYGLCCGCRAPNPRPPKARSEKNRWAWSDRTTSPYVSSSASVAAKLSSAPAQLVLPSSASGEADLKVHSVTLQTIDRSRAAQAAVNFQFLASNCAAAPIVAQPEGTWQHRIPSGVVAPGMRAVSSMTLATAGRRTDDRSDGSHELLLEDAEWATITKDAVVGTGCNGTAAYLGHPRRNGEVTAATPLAPAATAFAHFQAGFNFDRRERERQWSLLGGDSGSASISTPTPRNDADAREVGIGNNEA